MQWAQSGNMARLILMCAACATCTGFQSSFMRHAPMKCAANTGVSHRRLQIAGVASMSMAKSERIRPPEALADTVYNFAFGSNLDPEKRSSRGVSLLV